MLVSSLVLMCACGALAQAAGARKYLSHPPLRQVPPASDRPMEKGPGCFVDAVRGNDANAGTEKAPWRTINHAISVLGPGDTLYLRSGVFHENVYCGIVGRRNAPITIRSYPGEQAVIDGGIPEFQASPASAWKPCPDGAPGEYVSTRPYKNIRDVVGLFGDSNIGLQTYWHVEDLRAENELLIWDKEKTVQYRGRAVPYAFKPVYCGPGLWYNRETGYVHVRLAHTHVQNPQVANYRGETDPRRLPLVVAPFQSTPLFVDLAKHVRFQDLVIRGGGYKTVNLLFGVNIEFDNCTIFCGTYGIWAKNTGPLKMTHCGVYGMIPPWAFATENALYTYSPRYYDPFLKDTLSMYAEPKAPATDGPLDAYTRTLHPLHVKRRHISRLPTHAILVTEGGYEFETFYYPLNHDWDISYCEFTDGHDGVYPNGRMIRFHHNWIDNIQDDGIYLSSPTPYVSHDMHIYQNLVTRTASAFALHSRGGPNGDIYIYRNVVDLRRGVHRARPTPENPAGQIKSLQVFLRHGRPFLGVESLYWYQNTLVSPATGYSYVHKTLYSTNETTTRRSFNNVCVYLNRWPDTRVAFVRGRLGTKTHDIQADGNLHWCPDPKAKVPTDLLKTARTCEASQRSKKDYPPGWAANSIMAAPKFKAFSTDPAAKNDYRLQEGSPAIRGGVVLPAQWEDPLRPKDGARPDMGAIPFGREPLRVGRHGRMTAGAAGPED